ncbi:Na+ dependent nucleoside transporter C-terminus-domain-containing protein [Blastocladiella britannica]|nr:Na+ dependent nucleoside transporter C-terminus-domain-containing protein [Blastocladiella britannica]
MSQEDTKPAVIDIEGKPALEKADYKADDKADDKPAFEQAETVEWVDSTGQRVWDFVLLSVLTAWIIAAWVSDNVYAIFFAVCTLTIAVVTILVAGSTDLGTIADRFRSLLGVVVVVALMFVLSKDRSAVNWRLVSVGMFAQMLLGLFVLKTWIGQTIFSFVSNTVGGFLGLGKEFGLEFLWFGANKLQNFFVNVLPAIVFFCSFIQCIYYLGGMQWLVVKFAYVFVVLMDTSGAESVAAAASPFIGQGESALLILPFLPYCTNSEMHAIMVAGFATIAGSVLSAYIGMGVNGTYLITACIMSVPCSLALSKLIYPETEKSITKGEVIMPAVEHHEANILHAAANGAAQGMTLAGLIAGTLLSLIALYNFVDIVFTRFFFYLNNLGTGEIINLELVTGYLFYPLAWLLGVPTQNCLVVAQLLGKKVLVNEFAAYADLQVLIGKADILNPVASKLTARAELLISYALCGFANIGSVGIQIGCLGAMAPSRRGDIASIAFPAMLVGALCTFTSACIAGIFA